MIIIYNADNAEKLREYIGDDLYIRQRSIRHICVPVNTHAHFLTFYRCNIKNTHKNDERVCIYCGERELIFVGDSDRCVEILKALPQNGEPFHTLAEFLSELTSGDIDELERVENDINELERKIITTEKPVKGTSSHIIELRHSFLRIKRYYEQLGIVVDQLVENENNSIPPDILNRFAALSRRIHYLTKTVMDLREYVTQVREAYQARIDIEQNQIMKVFTVLSAVFLPLTLIVGWYGMNFKIPELSWRFGYLYVMILSAAVCAVCFYIFKRKKWF